MIERRLQARLRELLEEYPAVALLGPRQVGKTTLAHEIAETLASVYLDLEAPPDRAKLADPSCISLTTKTDWSFSTRCTEYRTCSEACAG